MDILERLRAWDRACRTAITRDRTHSAGWEIYGQAVDEIERLGRCNDELSRSHAEVVNAQNAEIQRLREERVELIQLRRESKHLRSMVQVLSCELADASGQTVVQVIDAAKSEVARRR